MRVFRVITGSVVALVGLTVLVVGALAAFRYVGPDDVVSSSPRELKTEGVAIATPPDLLDYHGNRMVVTVEPVDSDRHVFVGVAHDVDVRSYLSESRYLRIIEVRYPLQLATREVAGDRSRVIPPASLDWWARKATGSGTQTLSWRLEDGPYDLVIMHADGDAPVAVRVSFGIELPGAFRTALLVAVGGLVILVLGLVIAGVFRRRPPVVDDDDQVQWEGGEAWSQNEFWRTSQPAPRVTGPRTPVGNPMEPAAVAAGSPAERSASPHRPATPPQHDRQPSGEPVPPRQGPPAYPQPPTTQPRYDQPPPPFRRQAPPPPHQPGHQRPPGAYASPPPSGRAFEPPHGRPTAPSSFPPPSMSAPPMSAPPTSAPPTSTPRTSTPPSSGVPSTSTASASAPPSPMAPRHAGPSAPFDRPGRPAESPRRLGEEPPWSAPSRPDALSMPGRLTGTPPVPSAPPVAARHDAGGHDQEGVTFGVTGASHESGDVRHVDSGNHVDSGHHVDSGRLDGDGVVLGADYAEPPPWLPGPVGPVVPAPAERKDGADRG